MEFGKDIAAMRSNPDMSIHAEIVELLDRLVHERDRAMLCIAHDLLSVRLLADEILVLNKGKVVEDGPVVVVIRRAQAPYTRTLLGALPNPVGPLNVTRADAALSVPLCVKIK